ncbi:MAG: glycosyltransferase family 8 protein [Acidimicrobiales bacterium]
MPERDGLPRPVVATAFDDRYLWPWACTVFSAVESSREPVRVLVANTNNMLSAKGANVAKALLGVLGAEGKVVDIIVEVKDFARYQWNATVYARLGLLDSLDEVFLWLDSDLLLRPGWQTIFELGSKMLEDQSLLACAVRDRQPTLDLLRKEGTNEAYLAAGDNYFNTGVFLADPRRWRSAGLQDKWVGLVGEAQARGFVFPDQDVLNFLLAGRAGLLAGDFNHIVSEPTSGREVVLHYAGYPKPWALAPAGRAFFVATEALNEGRPEHQISGGGTAWQLFPAYWDLERRLQDMLKDRGEHELLEQLLCSRAQTLVAMSPQERVKLLAMRALARRILRARGTGTVGPPSR